MKKYRNQLGILTLITSLFLTIEPLTANNNQITGLEFSPKNNGVELKLKSLNKEKKSPSFLTAKQGKFIRASILNSQIKLPKGKTFRQDNPAPGIASVKVTKISDRTLNVLIESKTNNLEQVVERKAGEIIFNLSPQFLAQTTNENQAQVPTTQPSSIPTPPGGVMVPNPEILIDGKPAPENTNVVQNNSNAPAFLPRAVAPPVGDMAVSNLNTMGETVNLGSQIIVPRLVLKDAPVREVLSLLARSANLNLVFTQEVKKTGENGKAAEQQPQPEPTISLDLQNEPVQDVFNSVLMVSGYQASRRGNTLYVGPKLPDAARTLISRTLRLNQVKSPNAAAFLATQGAEVYQLVTPIRETKDPQTNKVVERIEEPAELRPLTVKQGEGSTGALLLRGLSVSTDDRLNSITLVGEPQKVQLATSFLTQLDARRRQVAVNVKVVDVNLLGTEAYNASLSFGIGDSFFVQDNGSAVFNYGGVNPPSASSTNLPSAYARVTPFNFANKDAVPFLDSIPAGSGPYSTTVDAGTDTSRTSITTTTNLIDGQIVGPVPTSILNNQDIAKAYARPPFGTDINPFQPGISKISEDGIEWSLPSLMEIPKKFLTLLQAKVTSGNAKILTDPTMVVQEGQQASVKLTQQVVGNIKSETQSADGVTTKTVEAKIEEAGLTLSVNIDKIDDNGFISLSVNPTVTSIGNTQDISIDSNRNRIALLNKRELASGLIRLRDGQTLILSGIIQDAERTTVSKVPILGDIPILGALFRSTNKENQRNEIVVLLTPQIIDDSFNSGWGYNYTPGKESGQMLQQQGITVPQQP